MEYQIELSGLSFGYGEKHILDNINLNIKPGSFLSILGPNGSGKSTLLKNISTLLKPKSGIIFLDNKNILKMKSKDVAANISVVPQNTAIEFDFKVKDIVMMGRYPHISKLKGETKHDEEVVLRAMKYTNTLEFSDRYFNELSGGEKQRVILAQALAQEPKVILLDEPISHLDLQHQIEILDLIKRMSVNSNLTVIAVLHDLNLASVYSDYIVMIKDGKIGYSGKPHEVLTVESIKDVFNTDVHISISPVGNRPYIYTITKPYAKKNGIRVHVICGGGSGNEIINDLYNNGFEISTGVLNSGDLDWKIAKDYDIEVAEEVPFGEISTDVYKENLILALKSDYIVLAETYFSSINIKNLQLLLDSNLSNKPILILGDKSFKDRDYSEGEAYSIYKKIKSDRNVKLVDAKDLCKILKAGYQNGEL